MRAIRHISIQGETAQSMIEFGFVLPFLLLLLCGLIDFGFAFSDRIAITNAARTAVRYATTHPSSWSNAANAPVNSIEGQVQSAGGTASVPNDDAHILISYLNPDGSACGHYSTSGFVGSQSSCVVAGNLIQVQVTFQYNLITPVIRNLFPNGVIMTSSATMAEEQ